MTNLDKLNSQFDLNNLDSGQILKLLAEHQNSLIKAALIGGSLILGVMIFNDHNSKQAELRVKISKAQEKLDVIKSHDDQLQELNDFKAGIPKKLDQFELITLISNFAKDNQVEIASLTPVVINNMGLYDVMNITFNMKSNNFKDMMLFLRKMERSKSPLRVDGWDGHEDDSGRITFTIQVSAVLIHS